MAIDERFDEFLKEYRDDRGEDREWRGDVKRALEVAEQRLNDHGQRLRALEMFRNWAGGVGAVAAVLWASMKVNIKVGQ